MRITAFHIDGFGMFHDFAVRDLGDGLTVFYGLNETGKSTLLDFIRYTLFGYPDRRSKKNLHEPLRGGQHGGRIEIATDEGRIVTVECAAGQAPNLGVFGDEQQLRHLFRGLTHETFDGYFAFDLTELTRERFGIPAEVEPMLLDAAQAGRLRSPASVRDQLADEMAELYRRKGQKQPFNVALDALHQLRREIRQCQERPREYDEKRRALEELDQRIAQLQEREGAQQRAVGQLKELCAVQPLFVAWREAKELLERTEKIVAFPAEGVARLEKLDEAISSLFTQVETKRVRIAELQGRLAARPADRRWLEQASAIERLARQRSVYEKRAADLIQTESDLEITRGRADACLARLGQGWTADKARAVATDLLAEDRIRQPLDGIARVEQDLSNQRKELGDERARLQSLDSQWKERQAAVAAEAESRSPTLSWVAPAIGGGVIVVLALGFLAAGQTVVGLALLVVGVVFGVASQRAWNTAWRLRLERQTETRRFEDQLVDARARVETRQRDVEGLERALEEARGAVRSAFESVGLPAELSPDTALEAFAQIRHLQEALAASDRLAAASKSERKAFHDLMEETLTLAITLGAEVRGPWDTALTVLERRLEEERRVGEEERRVAGEIAAIEREIALLDQQRGQREKERSDLLAAGGAPDDPELFRRRSQKAQVYGDTRDRFDETEARLLGHCPGDETTEHFLKRLEQTDWAEVESQFDRGNSELQELQKEHRALLENRGRLDQEITSIEQEERLFDLRQREEATRARLAELARRWNVLAVADALLRRVQETYDRERQPARIRRASEFFRRFTRDSFERIKLTDEGQKGEKAVIAVRSNLEELRPAQLSRGTCEQLYLALRLALVEELRERGIVLPLIFDDILVNFDDARARATAEASAELARDRQVWFFTAHGPTLALLRDVGLAREVHLTCQEKSVPGQ